MRLGLYHPHPRLCLDEEPAQRDLRVLRAVFGVLRDPGTRLDWPWYVLPLPASTGPGMAAPGIMLDTSALWGKTPYRLRGGHPKLPTDAPTDRLAAWRDWTLARIPGARAPETAGLALLEITPAEDPFFASRLAGSRVLPFQLGWSSTTGSAARPEDLCRDWPAGVRFTPRPRSPDNQADAHSYVLDDSRTEPGPAFRLTGYREQRLAWRDYYWGRLDALLLEGGDLMHELERHQAGSFGPWGRVLGTQQLVLRWAPGIFQSLGADGRLALSLALSRRQLAMIGEAQFVAAERFLAPVTAPTAPPSAPLLWDSLQARRLWLSGKRKLPELRLAVLAHPLLEKMAERIQAQWSRTLNLNVRVLPLAFDQFAQALAAGKADLVLDVLDLDDGSLQNLWLRALDDLPTARRESPQALPPEALQRDALQREALQREALQRWERSLAAHLPYLPLVGNVHWVLLPPGAPWERMGQVCPGCAPVDTPGRTAPEPVERNDPRG